MEYSFQLVKSNLRESQLQVSTELLAFCKANKVIVDLLLNAICNITITLQNMSRYPEAEVFSREMVAKSEKETPVREVHARSIARLAMTLVYQHNFEEVRRVAHDAVEPFRPYVPEGDAIVRLMEAELNAFRGLLSPKSSY
jgi:hypothetical protein